MDRYDRILKAILDDHPECLRDRRLLRALLSDLIKDSRMINMVMMTFDSGILSQIYDEDVVNPQRHRQWVKVLSSDYGVSTENAEKAITIIEEAFEKAIIYDGTNYVSYEIEDNEITITAIDDSVVRKIQIPDTIDGKTVRNIGKDGEIDYGGDLKYLCIPKTVSHIEEGLFAYSEGLYIDVSPDNNTYKSDDGVLIDYKRGVLLFYPEKHQDDIRIPEGIVRIGKRAFEAVYPSEQQIIELSQSVKELGEECFDNSKLTIVLHNGIEVIERGALRFCRVRGINAFLKGETVIEDFQFEDCIIEEEDEDIVIPDSVLIIGLAVFSGAKGISSILVPESVKIVNLLSFASIFTNTPISIYIEKGVVEVVSDDRDQFSMPWDGELRDILEFDSCIRNVHTIRNLEIYIRDVHTRPTLHKNYHDSISNCRIHLPDGWEDNYWDGNKYIDISDDFEVIYDSSDRAFSISNRWDISKSISIKLLWYYGYISTEVCTCLGQSNHLILEDVRNSSLSDIIVSFEGHTDKIKEVIRLLPRFGGHFFRNEEGYKKVSLDDLLAACLISEEWYKLLSKNDVDTYEKLSNLSYLDIVKMKPNTWEIYYLQEDLDCEFSEDICLPSKFSLHKSSYRDLNFDADTDRRIWNLGIRTIGELLYIWDVIPKIHGLSATKSKRVKDALVKYLLEYIDENQNNIGEGQDGIL